MDSVLNSKDLLFRLHEIEAFKFGKFKLKSGIISPVYFDLRVIISFPKVLEIVADLLWDISPKDKNVLLCGVPYTALPIASVISVKQDIPMLIRRKEAKDHGTMNLVEGRFNKGDECLIVEDVISTGSSVLETARLLRSLGLVVKQAVVLVDREQQGGKENIQQEGIQIKSVFNLKDIITLLHESKKISDEVMCEVKDFLSNHKSIPVTQAPKQPLTYEAKLLKIVHPIGKRLLETIVKKESNLCLSGDTKNCQELLELVKKIGPHICMLKIHSDTFSDFDDDKRKELKKCAEQFNFLIMDDRKFADIGNTVVQQLTSGPQGSIFDWADLVTVHAISGPGVLQAVEKVCESVGSGGCVIVAEMSSKGALTSADYKTNCEKMAKSESGSVVGFVSQSPISQDPRFLHFTPGVKLEGGGDSIGQQYTTPDQVMAKGFCDVVIVGRGILHASDPVEMAQTYQRKCFDSYKCAINSNNF